MIGLLFPGQGSQFVGMGRELIEAHPSARALYARADDVLGLPLSRVMLEGPQEELTRTELAQPALFTAAAAAWTVLTERWTPDPDRCLAAGHSLGEYAALWAAGVLDFDAAVMLVHRRGQFMAEAAAAAPGGMAAVLGQTPETVESLCHEADPGRGIQVANLNGPGQVVVSGSRAALDAFAGLARERRIKVIPLAVSGSFHSRFMQPAGERLAALLAAEDLKAPSFPVLANVSAEPVNDPESIRRALAAQVSGSVRWEETVRRMCERGMTLAVEIGPGRVLQGLLKKIAPEVPVFGAFSPEALTEAAARLAEAH